MEEYPGKDSVLDDYRTQLSMHLTVLSTENVPEPTDFAPCAICGRTFNQDVLVSHTYRHRKLKYNIILIFWYTGTTYQDLC